MEIKQFTLEEFKADDDGRSIEGYGSVFNNVDNGRDIVLPGAFKKSIAESKPAMLWQHKTDQPIGVWDEVKETQKGLLVKGRILDTQLGNDAYKLAKGGALTGMSIGYAVKEDDFDAKTGIRQLKQLKLYEISLVTFPMNEKATITRVKTMPQTLREFEEFLREEGKFSREDATTIALRGYKALNPGREAEGEEPDIIELLNKFKV